MGTFLYNVAKRIHEQFHHGNKYSGFLDETQWWSRESLRSYQDENLQSLMKFVYENVPYYRRVMKEIRLTPSDIISFSDLQKLPILTRELVRSNIKELHASRYQSYYPIQRSTGGTTGEPLTVDVARKEADFEDATFERFLHWVGYKLGEPMVKLFGGSLGLGNDTWLASIKARIKGITFLPAFELSPKNVSQYVEAIAASGARCLRGYTSAIWYLATLVQEQGLHLSLDAVLPTAEILYPEQRDKMTEVFGGEVFDQYGCGEANSLAMECPAHTCLHFADEHVILETINEETLDDGCSTGEVVLTQFYNYSMPLIRYVNGDRIVRYANTKKCTCGRGLTMIKSIEGRYGDMLVAKDGRKISASFGPHLFLRIPGVQQFQIVQHSLDEVEVKVIPNKNLAESSINVIRDTMVRYLGQIHVVVNVCSQIPKTSSGKLRFVISKISSVLNVVTK